MQPIRRVQSATHFKRVSTNREGKKGVFWTPCSPGDRDAVEKTWMDVKTDELMEPELTVRDFIKALRTSRPTVNQDDLRQQIKFTQEFGQEG